MDKEIKKVRELISPIIGLKTWGVSLGQGSFITFEFGGALPPDKITGKVHGEWHIWIYNSVWRLETNDTVVVGSEDSRLEIETAIKKLENLTLSNINFLLPGPDTIFEFENSIKLRVIPVTFHEECDYWILYMPTGKTLTLQSGPNWVLE